MRSRPFRSFLLVLLAAGISVLGSSCSDDEDDDAALNLDMVLIPAGSFTMGDASGTTEPNERPAHTVSVNAFFMSSMEISQALYEQVIGFNPSQSKGKSKPVEKVTWYDALRFCNALSTRDGFQPVYTDIDGNLTADFSADGYRLPTEAEWEYACRAGTTTPYYTGSTKADLDRCAWYSGNAGDAPRDRGLKEANSFGLYDMHGNVYEWCWDWYGSSYYSESVNSNPRGPAVGQQKICRGGSWFVFEYGCRSSFRSMLEPEYPGIDIGFRIVRTAG
ncbi:MAG: formylglycine-generating enzyme family protein [Bacteroidetes bacterium]|nr:formylglycine-generating enzyme family protein [Bacteroidota bacterium]